MLLLTAALIRSTSVAVGWRRLLPARLIRVLALRDASGLLALHLLPLRILLPSGF